MKPSMVYIDDSQNNLDCISLILENDYEVETFSDPVEFLRQYPQKSYETILLDIHMPRLNGFVVYEKIIEEPSYNGCPIFFISSDDSDSNRIKSFALGAVDFLNRNLPAPEMITRIKTKVTFVHKHRSIIEFGNLKLDLTLLKCFLGDEELKLTFIEFKLLCHFLKTFPAMTLREELAEKVWNNNLVLDATIYTHIFNINAKLGAWDHEITTARNRGMVLVRKARK